MEHGDTVVSYVSILIFAFNKCQLFILSIVPSNKNSKESKICMVLLLSKLKKNTFQFGVSELLSALLDFHSLTMLKPKKDEKTTQKRRLYYWLYGFLNGK